MVVCNLYWAVHIRASFSDRNSFSMSHEIFTKCRHPPPILNVSWLSCLLFMFDIISVTVLHTDLLSPHALRMKSSKHCHIVHRPVVKCGCVVVIQDWLLCPVVCLSCRVCRQFVDGLALPCRAVKDTERVVWLANGVYVILCGPYVSCLMMCVFIHTTSQDHNIVHGMSVFSSSPYSRACCLPPLCFPSPPVVCFSFGVFTFPRIGVTVCTIDVH